MRGQGWWLLVQELLVEEGFAFRVVGGPRRQMGAEVGQQGVQMGRGTGELGWDGQGDQGVYLVEVLAGGCAQRKYFLGFLGDKLIVASNFWL